MNLTALLTVGQLEFVDTFCQFSLQFIRASMPDCAEAEERHASINKRSHASLDKRDSGREWELGYL